MLNAQSLIDCSRVCERHLELAEAFQPFNMSERARRREYARARVAIGGFQDWFRQATPGELLSYHKGPSLSQARLESASVDTLAKVVAELGQMGYLSLIQQRTPLPKNSEDDYTHFQYQCRRTSKGFIPSAARGGRSGSSPSPAYGGRVPGVGKTGEFVPPVRPENVGPTRIEHYGESSEVS